MNKVLFFASILLSFSTGLAAKQKVKHLKPVTFYVYKQKTRVNLVEDMKKAYN